MTSDPINAYRSELRRTAARRITSHMRRRRVAVSLAVAISAFLLVGGAIAAQNHWFEAPSTYQMRIRATHDQFDHLTKAFSGCMATHGAHPVKVRGGGFRFRNASAAETACGSYVTAIAVNCGTQLPPSKHTTTDTQHCTFIVQRTIAPKPTLKDAGTRP